MSLDLSACRILFGCLIVGLLLLFSGCSGPSLEPVRSGMVQDPPARLQSPLLERAAQLLDSESDRNHLTLLEIGRDALLARIHLIRSAEREITIQTMIWANDETGRLIMYELLQAARRGVQVKLLIDHLASEQHIEIATFLAGAHPNLQIKLYNPIIGFLGQYRVEPSLLDKLYATLFGFKRLNQRMHNKTFIVDGLVGLTGGRNYQNAYYDQARGMNYKDRDVMVLGPVVAEMSGSFNRYWDHRRAMPLADLADVKRHRHKEIDPNWYHKDSFRLNGLFKTLEINANRPELIKGLLVDTLQPVEHAYFVADDPKKRGRFFFAGSNRSRITLELAELVSSASESVTIQTPYLVLTQRAIDLFKALHKEHPQIALNISTNSLAATDSWYVYALSYKQKQVYLDDLNFRIFEFKPQPEDLVTYMPDYAQLIARPLTPAERLAIWKQIPDGNMDDEEQQVDQETWEPAADAAQPYFCLHAKSLVVDSEFSFIGSYNLDPRSENINTECGLVIRDKPFAEKLQALIFEDMRPQNSWVIARKKRPLGVEEGNALMVKLSHILPIVDIWPFRYTASFELLPGKAAVPVEHPDFYDNYRDVGSFPQVTGTGMEKQLGARGTKAFLSIVKPLL